MVTRIGERGQVSVRSAAVDDAWEQLVKTAAKRNGQSFADFIVDTTRVAAQALLKGETAVSAALPVRLEDIAAEMREGTAELREGMADLRARLADQQKPLTLFELHELRRGRWVQRRPRAK